MPSENRVAANLAEYLSDPSDSRLPEPVEVDQSTERVVALYEASGHKGATFNIYFGNMDGQPFWAVGVLLPSLPPPQEAQTSEEDRNLTGDTLDQRKLHSFIAQNYGQLRQPRCNVGIWYDAKNDAVVFDVSVAEPDHGVARRLGEENDQDAIYHLQTGEVDLLR